MRPVLVIVGNGMVGQRLVDVLLAGGALEQMEIVVFGEERRAAYDRVGLSSLFAGASPEELSLVSDGGHDRSGLAVHLGERVAMIDREARTVTSDAGRVVSYSHLVLATGSSPFVPPLPGHDSAGCHVYRTIDDVDAITADAKGRHHGVVIGGGLLGLEAANALRLLGLDTHVVEMAPRLMPVQLDDGAGGALRSHIEDLGVTVHTGAQTKAIDADGSGRVAALRFADDSTLPADILVFSAGIRPRDDLARAVGLEIGERGAIVVDDRLTTSDPAVSAIGECALHRGRVYGLVSPGYQMARVLAERLLGGDATFEGADTSTKLKLMGVDVASFGDAFAAAPGTTALVFDDTINGVHKRLVVDRDTRQVIGGMLVGDASMYATLTQMARGEMPTPARPELLITPQGEAPTSAGIGSLADAATVCSCNNVTKGAICNAIVESGLTDVAAIKSCTNAGTGCGGCAPLLVDLLKDELRKAGTEVGNDLCEHFSYSRQELFDLVRVQRLSSFSEVIVAHGRSGSLGCEVCKPAVASMLASLGSGYILDGEQATLQDTNDHFLANLQRDGTYSVVPRVPGGEITPDQLIAIGAVAKEFGLYTKITGGQRIDLFGARVEQLPGIWERLIHAGMESGHAYGKALRTVKSCVGTTWCRFGVQDSTSLAIRLELRYRGLRAPHKIKCAVSGCARECAEAQSKDVGVIATERGWNLYVCGNGGMRPQHAVVLAEDVDTDTLIRYIDRFLMFYVRTADRLERTAPWLNKLDGGIDHLRRVIVDDALGLATELEGAMAHHVDTYECEWKATLQDPARLAKFRSFVNADVPDPSIRFEEVRGQIQPVPAERAPASRTAMVSGGA